MSVVLCCEFCVVSVVLLCYACCVVCVLWFGEKEIER